MKYVYPAIFKEEDGVVLVRFPDFDECITFGETVADAMMMAKDVLCLHLYNLEEKKMEINEATNIRCVERSDDEFVSLIACDTLDYRKFYGKQAVKKTLTIPAWLNTLAENANVNFSNILQQALKAELKID